MMVPEVRLVPSPLLVRLHQSHQLRLLVQSVPPALPGPGHPAVPEVLPAR